MTSQDHSFSWKHFLLFCIGGGLGALVNWGTTLFLTELFGLWYVASYLIAQGVNLLVNFTFHRLVTFRKHDVVGTRFAKFLFVSISTIFLNVLMVYAITEWFSIFYLFSIIFATFVFAILNYFLNKMWVFR